MLEGRKPEPEVVVAIAGIVVVPIVSLAVVSVVVPTAAPVHAIGFAGLVAVHH